MDKHNIIIIWSKDLHSKVLKGKVSVSKKVETIGKLKLAICDSFYSVSAVDSGGSKLLASKEFSQRLHDIAEAYNAGHHVHGHTIFSGGIE